VSSADPIKFSNKKKPWSAYKDLILDYYLQPYLAKIAQLRRPVAVVDCFAGAGRFNEGGDGSPLIILRHLEHLSERGFSVQGLFIEREPQLYDRLTANLASSKVPTFVRLGSFRDYVSEIAELAETHSVLVYVDPLKAGDLLFDDLSSVYDKLRSGQSVETLVNFMSANFVRGTKVFRDRIQQCEKAGINDSSVRNHDDIAGGEYWRSIVLNKSISERERIDRVATCYAERLNQWFRYVLHYAVREKYSHTRPKYHLVFGTRHPDAVDLMNRAMVKARREFVGTEYVKGMLFENQPKDEVVDEARVIASVLATLAQMGQTTWKDLRVAATVREPCRYTDSEWNQAIKRGIVRDRIESTASGKKIEENAPVSIRRDIPRP